MRLIDADVVKINYIGGFNDTFEIDYDSFMNTPTIDLVTCAECKWSVEDDYKMKCWNIKGLNKTDGVVNPNDFCSYGERRES